MFGNVSRLRSRLRSGGGGNSVPWYLSDTYKADGYSPDLFLDFIEDRYSANQSEKPFDNLIGFTRSFGNGTITKSDGYVEKLLANTPRQDYNPTTLAKNGLFLQPALKNFCTYSEDPTNAAWSKTLVTAVYDAAVINPYGTLGAVKVIPDAVAGTHLIYNGTSQTAVAPDGIAGKIFVKSAGYNIRIALNNSTNGDFGQININTTTGAINGSPLSTQHFITERNDGWWEIDLHAIAGTSKATRLFLYILDGSYASNFTPDGVSGVYIFGAQITSKICKYIPSISIATDDFADVAVLSSSQSTPFANWFNPTEGTFVVEFEPFGIALSTDRNIISIDDTTANEVIKIDFTDSASDGIKAEIIDGGVSQFSSTIYNFTNGQSNFAVITYKANDSISAANEDLGGLDVAVTLPTVTRMVLGQQIGWLKRVAYFGHRISDLETVRISGSEFLNG